LQQTAQQSSCQPAGLIVAPALIKGEAMATEEPEYKILLQEDPFEVRAYPALVAAETTVPGDRSAAVSAGFQLLAGYIFGANSRRKSMDMTAPVIQTDETVRTGESIAMTAPVMQTQDAGEWTIRFTMPRLWTLETLPQPDDPRVRLVAVPSARVAVVKFSGLAPENDIRLKTLALQAFALAHRLIATGPPSLARYDPPWTLWFLRRNEVMIPLQTETPLFPLLIAGS
jgi:hypothetical protein